MAPNVPPISSELAKALSNGTTARILMELRTGPLSPKECWTRMGGDFATVYRGFKRLEGWGLAEVVETKTGGERRGGVEHIYAGTTQAWVKTADWQLMPLFQRSELSGNVLSSYFMRVAEALEAGTFDAETDRHLSWDTVTLDRQAWEELGAALDSVLDSLSRLASESRERLDRDGGEEILTTVGLSEFRSPDRDELKTAQRRR
jgi:hypothetical protein